MISLYLVWNNVTVRLLRESLNLNHIDSLNEKFQTLHSSFDPCITRLRWMCGSDENSIGIFIYAVYCVNNPRTIRMARLVRKIEWELKSDLCP